MPRKPLALSRLKRNLKLLKKGSSSTAVYKALLTTKPDFSFFIFEICTNLVEGGHRLKPKDKIYLEKEKYLDSIRAVQKSKTKKKILTKAKQLKTAFLSFIYKNLLAEYGSQLKQTSSA